MKIRFIKTARNDGYVTMCIDPFHLYKKCRQDIADYLLGKYDQGMIIYQSPINERQLLMSYLPFVKMICFSDPEHNMTKNEIELVFESSSMATPATAIMEVSDELYEFLSKK